MLFCIVRRCTVASDYTINLLLPESVLLNRAHDYVVLTACESQTITLGERKKKKKNAISINQKEARRGESWGGRIGLRVCKLDANTALRYSIANNSSAERFDFSSIHSI